MRIAKLLNCIVKLRVGSDAERMGVYQGGQVLILSLLVLVVALTVGLSVAVRTITTTRMTTAEDSSQKAFSAAEAGLEQALTASAGTTITGSFTANNSSYKATTALLSGDQILANNGAFISKDDAVDVWLSTYPSYAGPWTGNLGIYWGNSDVCDQSESVNTMAAIEVILIRGNSSNPIVDHYAYDPCDGSRASFINRRGANNFGSVSPGGVVSGKNFAYSATIGVDSGLLARVIPLYAGAYIGVLGTGLPAQGTVITSIGNSGGTQRKIVTFRGYPKPPVELYPFLIFSPK